MYKNHLLYLGEQQPIKKDQTFNLHFDNPFDQQHLFKLRITGDSGVHASWEWEGGFPLLYRDIDDALYGETHHSQFSLRIKENKEDYNRRVYYKVQCPPRITPQFEIPQCHDTKWIFSLYVKGDRFKPAEPAAVVFERYLKKDGQDIRDINNLPDEVITLQLPEGSYDWQQITQEVTIDSETASVFIYITVGKSDGQILLEDPTLKNANGFSIIPQFTNSNEYHSYLNWFGENLSHREWTEMEITINGTVLEPVQLYQRCHYHSENEIAIPTNLLKLGDNEIILKNISDYWCVHPYLLHKLELLYRPNPPITIVYSPKVVSCNHTFGILISTAQEHCLVSIDCDSAQIIPEVREICLENKGLHVVGFFAGENASYIHIRFQYLNFCEQVVVSRIVQKQEDNVLTGTGDAIYIPQDIEQMEDFLSWYLHNGYGNFITFRPVYRWSGTRTKNTKMWQRMVELCNKLNLWYCHMIDGRELPGINANPTKAELAGDYFVGNQGHERDGAYYYWRQRDTSGNNLLFYEILLKLFKHEDFFYSNPIHYTETGVYNCFNPQKPEDMQQAAEQFVELSRICLKGIKRHTGPSVLFKYFFQAGLEVGGAELMYGPEEVILSSLRGASLAYERKEYAAHLAVQWSTTPHDTIERYRRYELALFICYLHGVHHINTEEGLYRMEEDFYSFDRFTEACKKHGDIQRKFTQFVLTHTRRGKIATTIGVLHGQNDGWVCFTRHNVWAQQGDKWAFSAPEQSWDLLKVFYPDAVMSAIYRHPCPNEPQGFYSRTPYGIVDILPIEADEQIMKAYGSLAFLGYNTACNSQIIKLIDYVRDGGTLLLSFAHLFTDTDRIGKTLVEAEQLIGVRLKTFDIVDGIGEIILSDTAKVRETLDGKPFIIENTLGKGKVILVNSREYPAKLGSVYETLLKELGDDSVQKEKQLATICTDDTVEFSTYDREDAHRIIYAVNTNWWTAQEATAALYIKGKKYTTEIQSGIISIFTVLDDVCVKTYDNETDVMSIEKTQTGFTIHVQGEGKITATIYCPYEGIEIEGFAVSKCSDGVFTISGQLRGMASLAVMLS